MKFLFSLCLSMSLGLTAAQTSGPGSYPALDGLDVGIAGIIVLDPESGEVIFEQNADLQMVPASTLKLITARTAWEILGGGYRFKTDLAYTGSVKAGVLDGDLVWTGAGDPTFGFGKVQTECTPASIFGNVFSALARLGIQRVKGKLVVIDPSYGGESTPGHWLWEDISNYYGAGASSFNFMGNRYSISFSRLGSVGDHAPIIGTDPHLPGLKISSEVRIGEPGSGDQAYVFGGPFAREYIVRGTIPPGAGPFEILAANHQPAELAGAMLTAYLGKQGIMIDSGYHVTRQLLQEGKKDRDQLVIIHRHESPALRRIISYMLSESDNLVAEALLRKCFDTNDPAIRTEQAAHEMMAYWDELVHTDSWLLYDGSGLAPVNRISARGMAEFLSVNYHLEDFAGWIERIPNGREIYGASALLSHSPCFAGTFLKSGSMENVQNYAGYLKTGDGSYLCIAAFFSGLRSSRSQLRKRFFTFLADLCKAGSR